MSIYEVHLGSWRWRVEKERYPWYRKIADQLALYCQEMGYTHVELLPVTEYPFDGSWGYQVTGYFAPTSRYGTPQDFMYFIDTLHQAGIGVIMDWAPAHFPRDEHGLRRFDGTALFEHENPIQAEHPEWGTLIFNYGRPEVQSFLISSAMHFFDQYHIDGLRVDAVSSMLYLDYGRNPGHFVPNKNGGNISLEAMEFLRKLNEAVLTRYPGCFTMAEESTAYPLVTRPPYDDGLGFTFKWDMGFMHDMLEYLAMDPYFRHDHHDKLTFSMMYAFSEHFVLAFSHDEVVHGKKSLLDKMYGDYEEKFATLRTLFGYQFAHPGKKLHFMGSEFGQFIEWNYQKELDWLLLGYPQHAALQRWVAALNRFYCATPALWRIEDGWDGFTWLSVEEKNKSSVAFLRSAGEKEGRIAVACNFTPVPVTLRAGLPEAGSLRERLNSDEPTFGGSGAYSKKHTLSEPLPCCGLPHSVLLDLPPLSTLYYEFSPYPDAHN